MKCSDRAQQSIAHTVSTRQRAPDNGLVHVPHGRNVRHCSTWPVVRVPPVLHDNVPMAHLSCSTLAYAGTGRRRHATGWPSQPRMWLTPMGWRAAVAVAVRWVHVQVNSYRACVKGF
jgi:hypothetical protein